MSKEVKAEEATTEAAQAQEQAQEQSGAELTVQDLQAIKQIIDVATQRGAFKGNELMSIGQVYNKLDTFLTQVSQQQSQGE